MNTSLSALNEYLFDRLDALSNDDLKGEDLEAEIARSKAITDVADRVIESHATVLKAIQLRDELGFGINPNQTKDSFPMLEGPDNGQD